MTAYIATAVAAVLFVVVFGTGFALRFRGSPYPVPQLTIHKLISLAAAAFVGIALFKASQGTSFGDGVWIALAATALFFVVAVATGGILSTDRE